MADATPRWDGIVYGPVRSRRLGLSLGLNLLPAHSKLCGFDCPYCSCGFNTPRAPDSRWPSPDEVGHALRRALERLVPVPAWITFSGNGEPTLHPRFPVVVARVREARDDLAPGVRLAILSNGLALGNAAVRAALLQLDARILKLDPGPPQYVNRARFDAASLADVYRSLQPVTLQAVVARGPDWDGSSEASLAAWLPLVARAAPEVVQLCTLDRPGADPRVVNVPRERLLRVAAAIRETLPRCRVDVV
jgi:wyosine [tRNA(Phe)-imidazoG37] synthetase (radical SAM superfamily)